MPSACRRLAAALAFVLAFVLATAFAAAPVAAQPYEIVATQTEALGPFVRTDWVVQEGGDPLDRFGMHRIRRAHGISPHGIVLLLPPLANPFRFYETDPSGIWGRSFAASLARRGYEIWGYSVRGEGLVLGDCESGAVDCSAMDGWGLGTIVDDIAFIRDRIAAEHPGHAPIVGGFSLGATMVIATLNAHPDDYSAAIIFEGSLYTEDPEVIDLNVGSCELLDQLLAAGILWDGDGLPFVKEVALLAAADPDGPTPFIGFPPGFTNHQVLVFILSVPQESPLNQTPGFVRCAGDVFADEFFFCDDERTVVFSLLFNDYFDLRTVRDLDCGLAGDPTYNGDLAAFQGPVLLIGGGLSYAGLNRDLAGALTGSAEVTRIEDPEFGHADHWFNAEHLRFVERRVWRWLRRIRHAH